MGLYVVKFDNGLYVYSPNHIGNQLSHAFIFSNPVSACATAEKIMEKPSMVRLDSYELVEVEVHLKAEDSHFEQVVYCDECDNHGRCKAEESFRVITTRRPFCCAGGKQLRYGEV